MKKTILILLSATAVIPASLSYSGNASIGVSATNKSGSVNVHVGNPPPAPVVVERETVIIKEKHDNGKHKGHYKKHNKKHHDKGRRHRDND